MSTLKITLLALSDHAAAALASLALLVAGLVGVLS
ncbi:hypothetical protein HDC95_003112 [Microbacterium sp. AK031]|nr:hypothetical protein [Microbacterium sp. AK031]